MLKYIAQNSIGDYIEEELDDDRTYLYVYDINHNQIGMFSWIEQAQEFLELRNKELLV